MEKVSTLPHFRREALQAQQILFLQDENPGEEELERPQGQLFGSELEVMLLKSSLGSTTTSFS